MFIVAWVAFLLGYTSGLIVGRYYRSNKNPQPIKKTYPKNKGYNNNDNPYDPPTFI